jgi:lauroyl/myristoyl acyltransferase
VSGLLETTTDRLGPLGFYALRSLERCLSPSDLYSLLKPLALTRAAFESTGPVPAYFRKSPLPKEIRQARINYLLSRILEFFPDRLATAKWQDRFQTHGLHHVREARMNGRRVVLVCFHFGTYKLIPFWLRALGISVVGLLGGKSQQRTRAKRMKDRLSPFPELPTVLYVGDQMRKAIALLSAGHVLMLAADREASKQIPVPLDGEWSFHIATGAIRLALHYDAELIPCCMTDEGRWQFRLEMALPVPREHLASEFTMPRAAEYLLQQMLPHVRKHPEQSSNYLLNCFQRNTLRPTAAGSLI